MKSLFPLLNGIALIGLFASSALAVESCPQNTQPFGKKCAANLQSLFPTLPPAKLQTLNASLPLTKQAQYKLLFDQCMTFSSPAACNDYLAMGTYDQTKVNAEYLKAMNRMTVYRGSYAPRFVDIELLGNGKIAFDPTLIDKGDIGIVNVSVLQGKQGSTFLRCKSEIIVCGENLGFPCPQSLPTSCVPVASGKPGAGFQPCSCAAGTVVTACDPNTGVATCAPAPTSTTCAPGEIADGGVCKKPWDCSLADATGISAIQAACPNVVVTVNASDPTKYFPATMKCNGTKLCGSPLPATCAAGNWWDGSKCTPCGAGEFSTGANSPSCQKCNGGVVIDGGTACKPCEPGTFSADGKACSPCAQASYQDLFGQTSCKACQGNIPAAVQYVYSPLTGLKTPASCDPKVTACVKGYTVAADQKSCTQDDVTTPTEGKCPATLVTWNGQFASIPVTGTSGLAHSILGEASAGFQTNLYVDTMTSSGLTHTQVTYLTAMCRTDFVWRFTEVSKINPYDGYTSDDCVGRTWVSSTTLSGNRIELPSMPYPFPRTEMGCKTENPGITEGSKPTFAWASLPAGTFCSAGTGSTISGLVGSPCIKVQNKSPGTIKGYSYESWKIKIGSDVLAVEGRWERVFPGSKTLCTCE